MEYTKKIIGGNFSEAGEASSAIKKVLKQLGVDSQVIRRTVVAIYEAEVNVVAHAYEGLLSVLIEDDKIKIVIEDEGHGIEDIEKAMEAGYSTASEKVREMGFGAGMGLPNIKANTDKMTINSVVGKGTVIELINYF
ncbi:MAG: anti-sigma regulatory factor [Bacteroidales bacterium]|jgi:anti-sigma regulatory factor (Ser/Thr protein kinase)|nr:anti-sigma regulatory factor [Bacteroidales bacterium]MDD4235240.1 anti-sigma regulatory factor [Bacteroidales bacterium]